MIGASFNQIYPTTSEESLVGKTVSAKPKVSGGKVDLSFEGYLRGDYTTLCRTTISIVTVSIAIKHTTVSITIKHTKLSIKNIQHSNKIHDDLQNEN